MTLFGEFLSGDWSDLFLETCGSLLKGGGSFLEWRKEVFRIGARGVLWETESFMERKGPYLKGVRRSFFELKRRRRSDRNRGFVLRFHMCNVCL